MSKAKFTADELVTEFPDASPKQIRSAIKYQEKFSLTLENLKCLNPDCNRMRKWSHSDTKFRYCCAPACTKIMQSVINHNAGKKAQQTYFENTGFESTMHNPEAVARHKQTSLRNNGVENIFFKKEYIDQKRLEKYGYSYPMQSPEIKNKIKQTCLEKYGFENPAQQHLLNYEFWNDRDFWIKEFITKNNTFNLYKAMTFFGCRQPAAHNQLKILNIDYTKFGGTSIVEQDIADYIKTEFNLEIVQNVRNIISPLELDIYIPALKLAIEYNGAYWHSYHPEIGTCNKQLDFNLMRSRHQQKSLACLNKGIRLLHIYEDEANYSKIEEFINWEYNTSCNEFDLDSGCYPINLKPEEFEILEPESQMVLNDRTLWNAGKLKLRNQL